MRGSRFFAGQGAILGACPPKPIDNGDLITLPFCLIEKLTLRPQSWAGDKRDVVSPIGQQLAGNKRVLLRTAENESCYDMNNFQCNPSMRFVGPL